MVKMETIETKEQLSKRQRIVGITIIVAIIMVILMLSVGYFGLINLWLG